MKKTKKTDDHITDLAHRGLELASRRNKTLSDKADIKFTRLVVELQKLRSEAPARYRAVADLIRMIVAERAKRAA
jgi:hypothetical protein